MLGSIRKASRLMVFLVAMTTTATFLTACGGAPVDIAAEDAKAVIPQGEGFINVANAQLQKLVDQQVTLIDIRRPEEWKQTGVVNSSNKLTFFSKTGQVNPQLVTELKRIAPETDKPVAIICRTGNRTRAAGKMLLTQLGYKTVYNVERGITKWIADGRQVIRE